MRLFMSMVLSRMCSYRCGSAGEPPGIPLSGTGHHTGHKLWPSHQLHNNKRQECMLDIHKHTHIPHFEMERKKNLCGDQN